MKNLITILVLASAFYGADSWACRPNIYGIQHNLAMATIAAVHENVGFSVLDLKEKSLTNFQMEFVSSDPRIGCPDRYKATTNLTFQNSAVTKSYQVDIISEHGKEDIITIKPVNEK
jgi:hypothetical protein